jgi:hypothetical protein
MPDDTTPSSSEAQIQGRRGGGGRESGNREPGGFRIRLSDNEMRAARAIQDSFGLRSTVAALGFAIRTLGQMLEEGQLDALVSQHRANQGAGRGDGARSGRRSDNRKDGRPEGRSERPPRVDPFARPARPAPPAAESDQPEPSEPEPEHLGEPPENEAPPAVEPAAADEA